MSGALLAVFQNVRTHGAFAGQQLYQGTYTYSGAASMFTWICPPGVTSVSVVCIGSGGNGGQMVNQLATNSAGGGGLGWKNNIAVTPGNSYTVAAADINYNSATYQNTEFDGATSYFISAGTVSGGGGRGHISRTGGSFVGDGGGNGGTGGVGVNGYPNGGVGGYSVTGGAGGAGGYAGNGGAGADYNAVGSAGSGGGGGGGGGGPYNYQSPYYTYGGGGGGGVGVLGQGASGAGGTAGVHVNGPSGFGEPGSTGGGGGGGGSGGVNGSANTASPGNGGSGGGYGGGGATGFYGSYGGGGAVRIIWQGQSSGTPRSFPSNAGNV